MPAEQVADAVIEAVAGRQARAVRAARRSAARSSRATCCRRCSGWDRSGASPRSWPRTGGRDERRSCSGRRRSPTRRRPTPRPCCRTSPSPRWRSQDIPDARPLRPDWFVTRPLLTGICGSDSKQILLDFGDGDSDNAMSGLCSFPQVMGHEVVAEVTELGPGGRGLRRRPAGGAQPVAVVRAARHHAALPRLRGGRPQPVLELRGRRHQHGHPHRRVERRHRRLRRADAGALHDALRGPRRHRRRARHLRRPVRGVAAQHHPPPAAPGRPRARVGRRLARLVRGRDPPRPVPRRRGRRGRALRRAGRPRHASSAPTGCSGSAPQQEMVEELAAWSGGVLRPTMEGLPGVPMCHPGGIDVAYDTVGKPETFEVEVRVLKARGTLVKSGVHAPGPLGVEPALLQGDQLGRLQRLRRRGGRRRPPARHPALPRPRAGRPHRPHRACSPTPSRLTDWQDAFAAIADQERSGAIKVAIDPQR